MLNHAALRVSCDESWGYQALGLYSPTSRYGHLDSLKEFVDKCHTNDIGVIMDFALVHFAVDDFGLAQFDGSPLYEYPHVDVAYNEWGCKNFMHSRREVRSFLQSAVTYWIKEYHIDGMRMDASFNRFMKELNNTYLQTPAFHESDYTPYGFEWIGCNKDNNAVYAFLRKSEK